MDVYIPMGAIWFLWIIVGAYLILAVGTLFLMLLCALDHAQWWRKLLGGKWRYSGKFQNEWCPLPEWCDLGVTEDWGRGLRSIRWKIRQSRVT